MTTIEHPPGELPLRITLMERTYGISTTGSLALGSAVVAALGTYPRSIEALLLAIDGIYSGATYHVVSHLIAHDRQALLWRKQQRQTPPVHAPLDTWVVTDAATYAPALYPSQGGLLLVNIEQRFIQTMAPMPLPKLVGEVAIFDGRRFLPGTVTYDLRGFWRAIN